MYCISILYFIEAWQLILSLSAIIFLCESCNAFDFLTHLKICRSALMHYAKTL